MPSKKSNRTKKTRKMHAAKKLGKVKPLAVGTSLLTTGTAIASQPSSHTGTFDGTSFSMGASNPNAGVPVTTNVPDVSVPPGTIIKP
jgi:hypothetical protein